MLASSAASAVKDHRASLAVVEGACAGLTAQAAGGRGCHNAARRYGFVCLGIGHDPKALQQQQEATTSVFEESKLGSGVQK